LSIFYFTNCYIQKKKKKEKGGVVFSNDKMNNK
jgi:hypothetical protein